MWPRRVVARGGARRSLHAGSHFDNGGAGAPAPADAATKSLLTTLYRSMLRAVVEYESEVVRAASAADTLARNRETQLLRRAVPELPKALNNHALYNFDGLRAAVRYAFRLPVPSAATSGARRGGKSGGGGGDGDNHDEADVLADVARRIDIGFAALRFLNERTPALAKLVYKPHSTAVTDGVRVEVFSTYLGRSEADGAYHFAYFIRLRNESNEPVTLVSRRWSIVDMFGQEETVSGAGVVGQQPTLEPGAVYEYRSGCPLRAPLGVMQGSYQFVRGPSEASGRAEAEQFDVEVKPFGLIMPTRASGGGGSASAAGARPSIDYYPWEEGSDGGNDGDGGGGGGQGGAAGGAADSGGRGRRHPTDDNP